MKKKLLISCCGLVSIFSSAFSQKTVIDSINSEGIMRSYRLYVPAIYDGKTARPLVINMHGLTSNAERQETISKFMPVADTANFLVVHPNGQTLGGTTFWNTDLFVDPKDPNPPKNDVLFLSNLIDHLRLSYNIDPSRIYATGISDGGFMAYQLACALGNRIAAVASVSGTMLAATQYGDCKPMWQIPVMHFHGTEDKVVPYKGNLVMISVDTVLHYWIKHNHTNPTPTYSNVPHLHPDDSTSVIHYLYSGGGIYPDLEFYKIAKGGHCWPGTSYPCEHGATTYDINATKEIWRFFSKYKLGQFSTGIEDQNISSKIRLSPNPVHDVLMLDLEEPMTITLTDIIGNTLKKEVVEKHTQIDVSFLAPGFYFVLAESKYKKGIKRFVKGD